MMEKKTFSEWVSAYDGKRKELYVKAHIGVHLSNPLLYAPPAGERSPRTRIVYRDRLSHGGNSRGFATGLALGMMLS